MGVGISVSLSQSSRTGRCGCRFGSRSCTDCLLCGRRCAGYRHGPGCRCDALASDPSPRVTRWHGRYLRSSQRPRLLGEDSSRFTRQRLPAVRSSRPEDLRPDLSWAFDWHDHLHGSNLLADIDTSCTRRSGSLQRFDRAGSRLARSGTRSDGRNPTSAATVGRRFVTRLRPASPLAHQPFGATARGIDAFAVMATRQAAARPTICALR
jgi:hypothetical protein